MNLNPVPRLLMPTVVVCGLCLPGCFRTPPSTNPNPGTAPANPVATLPFIVRTVTLHDLKELGLFYQTAANLGSPPAKLDDLDIKVQAPKLYQAVEEKHIILYWKANATNAPAGTSNTVLGYAADVPTKGGPVLMLDGSAKTMTAEEFNKAPKAGS